MPLFRDAVLAYVADGSCFQSSRKVVIEVSNDTMEGEQKRVEMLSVWSKMQRNNHGRHSGK